MTMMTIITIVVVEITGDNSWFYRPFQYPGNRFGDLQEGTQSSVQSSGGSDEEDVTAGGQCFSG